MTVDFSSFLGNENLKEHITQTVAFGTPSHAYLITGESGTGKTALAHLMLMSFACNGPNVPCHSCENCRKIEQKLAPDIITVSPEEGKALISVDQIRAVREEAVLSTTELPFKAFLIKPAHAMNDAAQNALLKLLEEPPAGVYFFLLTDRETLLLPTVRSRVQVLKTQTVSEADVEVYLTAHHPEAKRMKEKEPQALTSLIRRAQGNIGTAQALLLSRKRAFDAAQKAREFITLLSASSHLEFQNAATTLTKDRSAASLFLSHLCLAIRDLIAIKKTASPTLLCFESFEEAEQLSAGFTYQALTLLYDAASETATAVMANANLTTVLFDLCERAWQIKSR